MMSGAQIKIDRIDESSDPFDRVSMGAASGSGAQQQQVGGEDVGNAQIYRKILICGSPDAICYAQYLINISVQVYGPPEKNLAGVEQQQSGQHQQPQADMVPSIMPLSQHKPQVQVPRPPINSLLGHPPSILGLEHDQVEWMHRDQNTLATSGVCYF